MHYARDNEKAYAFAKDGKVGAGVRVAGEKKGNAGYSFLEVATKADVKYHPYGAGAGLGAEAQLFNFKDEDSETAVRAFGGDVGASAGIDLKALTHDEHRLGAGVNARASLVECKAGPIDLHLGIGVSTSAKLENGTVDARFAGWGVKVGRKVGFAVWDNEFTLDLGWVWNKLT